MTPAAPCAHPACEPGEVMRRGSSIGYIECEITDEKAPHEQSKN